MAPRFGEDLALEIDLDEIPALTLRREKTWARVRAAEFLTLNEKRELAGFAPVAGGDRVVMRRGERAMGPGAAREGA